MALFWRDGQKMPQQCVGQSQNSSYRSRSIVFWLSFQPVSLPASLAGTALLPVEKIGGTSVRWSISGVKVQAARTCCQKVKRRRDPETPQNGFQTAATTAPNRRKPDRADPKSTQKLRKAALTARPRGRPFWSPAVPHVFEEQFLIKMSTK